MALEVGSESEEEYSLVSSPPKSSRHYSSDKCQSTPLVTPSHQKPGYQYRSNSLSSRSVSSSNSNYNNNNNNNNNINNNNANIIKIDRSELTRNLTSFGFKMYHILEYFKYLNTESLSLELCLNWLTKNETNQEEENYVNLRSFSHIMNINKDEAFYIMKLSNNNNNTFDLDKCIRFFQNDYNYKDKEKEKKNGKNNKNENDSECEIENESDSNEYNEMTEDDNESINMIPKITKFADLSENEKLEYGIKTAMLESKIHELREQRRQMSEIDLIPTQLKEKLRILGFLTYEIELCMDPNNNQVYHRQTTLKWLLQKLDPKDKHIAKLGELKQSGFNQNECEQVLKKFDNNFESSNLWLLQDKPSIFNHNMITSFERKINTSKDIIKKKMYMIEWICMRIYTSM